MQILADVLESRINDRRGLHAAVLLQLPTASARKTATNVFSVPSNDVVRKFVVWRHDLKQTDKQFSCNITKMEEGVASAAACASSDSSFEQQLEIAMRQSFAFSLSEPRNFVSQNGDEKLDASVKAEMAVFWSKSNR